MRDCFMLRILVEKYLVNSLQKRDFLEFIALYFSSAESVKTNIREGFSGILIPGIN